MEIKRQLKEKGIKLQYLAEELDISRPTLNSYISLYDKGEALPSEKYEIIFDNLFNQNIETKDEFINVLGSFHDLIQRDIVLGVKDFTVEKTDLLNNLIQLMKKDIGTDDYNADIYAFINMLVRSYKEVATYKRFADYFLLLNGKKDITEISDSDKVFYSHCYDLMKKDTENSLEEDSELFSEFEKRVIDIIEAQKKQEEDLSKKVFKESFDELVREAIQDKIKQGYDVKDINPQELFDSIDLSKI